MMDPIYVVVCQNDKPHHRWGLDPHGPLVWETYTRTATLQFAQEHAARLENTGACRVARLVFEDHPAFAEKAPDRRQQQLLDALRQWRAAETSEDAEELANARAARDEAIGVSP